MSSVPTGPAVHNLTLQDATVLVGGELRGEGTTVVHGVRSPGDASPDDLAYVSDVRYLAELESSAARAVLVTKELADRVDNGRSTIVVPDGQRALMVLLEHFCPGGDLPTGVHPTAVLGREVTMGDNVWIGPYAVLGDGCTIGGRVRIGAHVVLGSGCSVGADSVLHPHTVLYPDVVLGERVVLHSGARVGVDGFGYVSGDEGIRRVPHLGPCVIQDDVEIGANACVDRGSLDRTQIGRGSKLDNLVHIGHNVRVGEHTLMAALVGIAGSVHIGTGTMWGGQSGAVDHQTVGDGAKIAGKAGVSSTVEPGETVMGFPSRPYREHMKALAAMYKLEGLRERVRKLETLVSGENSREDQ